MAHPKKCGSAQFRGTSSKPALQRAVDKIKTCRLELIYYSLNGWFQGCTLIHSGVQVNTNTQISADFQGTSLKPSIQSAVDKFEK